LNDLPGCGRAWMLHGAKRIGQHPHSARRRPAFQPFRATIGERG